ncbi:hypothetical protein, partial [Rathayibacter sp. VKM Ac-2630]|uniref:hypothetical protein n=1 Tax=Rathayibacter sp. VKM Ac-2630 TaxID=1938617 RepID=UPI0009D1E3B1
MKRPEGRRPASPVRSEPREPERAPESGGEPTEPIRIVSAVRPERSSAPADEPSTERPSSAS